MAPALRHLFPRREFDPGSTSAVFADEWSNPSNYAFTILLLIGGDLIHRALAQLAGGWITPVAFSFGWVSYAASSICSALGECRLMPDADTACCLINGKNGYVRGNNSWVLGRIMRDYESWMGEPGREKTESLNQARWDFDRQREEREAPGSGSQVSRPSQAGLVVSLWQPSTKKPSGEPGHDLLYWSGIIVTVVQLGIAAIPLGLSGDWGILMITAAATTLCYVTGALGQWKVEKWACRRLDTRDKKLGKSMIGTFFPGDLRENEVREWEAIAQEWKEKRSMNYQV